MINPVPNWIDTYANLLYKLGQKEASLVGKIALKLEPDDVDIKENLEKK